MNKKCIHLFYLFSIILFFTNCGNNKQTHPDKDSNRNHTSEPGFVLPQIPEDLTTPEERTMYLIDHYWDNFDFSDTTNLRFPEIIEPVIVNYLELLSLTDRNSYQNSLWATLDKSKEEDKTYRYFIDTCTKYLYDAASPIRNDEIYIELLTYLLHDPTIPEANRDRNLYRLKKASKNRKDSLATDFYYTIQNGKTFSLYSIESPYTLIFFYYPDCSVCKEHIQQLNTSPIITDQLTHHLLTILAFYPDKNTGLWEQYKGLIPASWINSYDKAGTVETEELYDIKASPTLYLLDRNKKVLLKDTHIERVEAYLFEHRPAFMQ
ncbi:MAG: DUF5106 domain-containing protein [Candidatus Azobacteroides sp.]|nr:DUF5106 domain-containing protein [Candidatus Azobacteroides sp.]